MHPTCSACSISTNVVVVSEDSDYGSSLADGFALEFEQAGGNHLRKLRSAGRCVASRGHDSAGAEEIARDQNDTVILLATGSGLAQSALIALRRCRSRRDDLRQRFHQLAHLPRAGECRLRSGRWRRGDRWILCQRATLHRQHDWRCGSACGAHGRGVWRSAHMAIVHHRRCRGGHRQWVASNRGPPRIVVGRRTAFCHPRPLAPARLA